jgi:hypothetical protein
MCYKKYNIIYIPTHFASSGTPPARRGRRRPHTYAQRELLTAGLGTRWFVAVFIYIFLREKKRRV